MTFIDRLVLAVVIIVTALVVASVAGDLPLRVLQQTAASIDALSSVQPY